MKTKNRIAFGSCNNQNLTNPLWDIISARHPDAFIWAGDAIYADVNLGMDIWSTFPPKPIYQSATPKSLHQLYNKQKLNPSYQNFIQRTNVTIFGTIDDHDYGMNNGDKNYLYKKESGIAFLDFIDINKNSVMYNRASKGLGVYGVIVLDFSRDDGDYLMSDEEAGLDVDLMNQNDDEDIISIDHEPRRVAIFVLDVRTNKTPWGKGKEAWSPNYDGDFLGEKQWSWFEKTIQKSNASVNIIVSGLQVHPYRVPSTNGIELWSHFPTSRQRLYDAILQDNVQAPILVSGDVHMAQFLRKDCMRTNDDSRKMRPLVEMTTSGMTHSWGTCFGCSSRLHTTWKYYPCHLFSRSLMTLAHFIFPMPDLMNSYNNKNVASGLYEHGGAENAKQGKQYALQLNFGEFEFDWKAKVVTMRVIGKESGTPPLLSASFSFDQLSGREPIHGKNQFDVTLSQFYGKHVLDGNVAIGEFICVNHQSNPHPIQINIGFICVGMFTFIFIFGPHLLAMSVIRRMLIRRNTNCK